MDTSCSLLCVITYVAIKSDSTFYCFHKSWFVYCRDMLHQKELLGDGRLKMDGELEKEKNMPYRNSCSGRITRPYAFNSYHHRLVDTNLYYLKHM